MVTSMGPVLRAGHQLRFSAPKASGHDDFVTSLALVSWASRNVPPNPAQALLRTDQPSHRHIKRPLVSVREGRLSPNARTTIDRPPRTTLTRSLIARNIVQADDI